MLTRSIEALGRDIVAYMLACEPSSLASITPSHAQREILDQLAPLTDRILKFENPYERHFEAFKLLSYDSKMSASRARGARIHCGGTTAEIFSDDSLEASLLALGVDIYPALLLPSVTQAPYAGSHLLPLSQYPAYRDFQREVLRDPSLSRLFPGVVRGAESKGEEPRELSDVKSHLIWSDATGGTLELSMIPAGIVQYAFDMCLISGENTEDALLSALSGALSISKRLASGRKVAVRTAIGLGNITFAGQDGLLRLPSGTFQNMTEGFKYLFVGEEDPGSVLLTLDTDLKILSIGEHDPSPDAIYSKLAQYASHQSTWEASAKEIQRRIDRCRFAILLASSNDRVLAPVQVVKAPLNPLQPGRRASVSLYKWSAAPVPPQEISSDDAERALEWFHRVSAQPTTLDMGMRRLLSAVSSRFDAMDGFVDAVVCWENLFGTSEGESTFRISGAMSILLEPNDVNKRKALLREVQELYRARSGLVHGSRELDLATAQSYRDRAIELALEGFRAVHDDDKLLHANDSSLRSRAALLGF